jgi:hypothetical protein
MRGSSIKIDVVVQSMELRPVTIKPLYQIIRELGICAQFWSRPTNITLTDSVRNAVGVVADRSVFLNAYWKGRLLE